MYLVDLINERGVKFSKEFYSEYLLNKFLNKVKRSKKLKLLCVSREW